MGKPHGNGQFTWANGAVYIGSFEDGVKSGFGRWRSDRTPLATCFEGNFKNDMKHGQGMYVWASGNVYRGEYKCDERDGFGEMRWKDGSVYVGQWVKNVQHG